MEDVEEVDGSMLEGGGQILRYAVAAAALRATSVRISKIRAARSQPGLRPQHLAGLLLVRDMCGGSLVGASVGSTVITCRPSALRAGEYVADTGTAGSCTLMAQAALPCALFAAPPGGETALTLRGGTDAALAPVAGYLQHVLLPTLRRAFGARVELQLVRRGFFPRGGGEVALRVHSLQAGQRLPPLTLVERGQVRCVTIHSCAAGRLRDGFERHLSDAVGRPLRRRLGTDVEIRHEVVRETHESAVASGGSVLLVADTSGGCLLGASCVAEQGKTIEAMAEQVVDELCAVLATDACVDQWLQDQLIIYVALAAGTSRIRCSEPTLHTRTAMCVCERLLPGCSFKVHRPAAAASTGDQAAWTLECVGAGHALPSPQTDS